MFAVNDVMQIPDEELVFSYARSGGPGGQNVNKVASKAILHWAVAQNTSIRDDVKDRLRALFPSRVTVDGYFVIQSQEYRDQERNREACLEKLREMLLKAATVPKKRRPSKPSRGSKERRLATKKHRAGVKSDRGRVKDD
jgi:ribosome-associated protein